MSTYDDYDPRDRRRRDDRPPYPPDDSDRRPRRAETAPIPPPASGSTVGKSSDIPPPPLGSAMKREGSRSRAPDLKPAFPDEASYLSGRSPDVERKNGDRERQFRERRNDYNGDESEAMRGDPRRTRSRREPGGRSRYDDGDKRPAASEVSGLPIRERRDRGHKSEGEDEYDRRRPPRDYDDRRREDRPRRRDPDPYYDEEPRRRPRHGVEYGAEPIKSSKRDDDAYRSDRDKDRRSRRNDDYEEDDRSSRRKSLPPRHKNDDDDYYDRGGRDSRRRRDDYDDRDYRRPARRRSYDDDDDYYRRRDDRDRRDRRDDRDRKDDKDRREPTQMKIGNKDFGPMVDKGQKYYTTLAPILGPIVMGYLKKH